MLGTLPIEWRFALWALHPTSPLTYRVSLHLQSVPTASPLTGCTRLSRSTRTLRPHASLLHKAAFQKVRGSRCAEAPLGAPHRCAPSRVSKTGLMQSGLRWRRSHSRRRSPVAGTRPTRRRLRALVVCLHRGISQALRASFWSVACGQSCCVCPAHLGPRRCAALACAVCPSAPKGLPQPTR